MATKPPVLPTHVEDTVRAIAQLHANHYRSASRWQRAVDRTVAVVGRPRFIALAAVASLAWVLGNLAVGRAGGAAWDAPPFTWLETAATLIALFTTLLILSTQRREDEIAAHRDRLTLELAILNERKSAKIIQLLEEFRRDAPFLADRVDDEAAEMSRPADPQSVHDAIQGTHDEALAAEPEDK